MTDIKRELIRDHEDHERLLEQLVRALEAREETAKLREFLALFAENLIDHLDTEERYLFRATAQAHRLEIEQLRTEHRRIRQAVEGLSVSLELNSLQRQAIDQLRVQLRAHGAHEERSLHRWLEMDEGVLARRGVVAIRTRRERASARMGVGAKVSA